MDCLCCSYCAVVVGYGYCVYDGWFDPYSTGDCNNYGAGTRHTGTESFVRHHVVLWMSRGLVLRIL